MLYIMIMLLFNHDFLAVSEIMTLIFVPKATLSLSLSDAIISTIRVPIIEEIH